MTNEELAANLARGETALKLALELIEKLDPENAKERFAMLMLYHHALACGQPSSPESMAKYLDKETIILMRELSISIRDAMGELS